LLIAGMLTCAHFFTDDAPDEAAIRTVADAMYRSVEWDKALDQAATLYMGWRPETGFLAPRWSGYNEALLLYILALGSPTRPVPEKNGPAGSWVSPWHFGISQGPVVLMIENHRSGLLWSLMRECPYIGQGLKRAGIHGRT
jgi:hypothetical protein